MGGAELGRGGAAVGGAERVELGTQLGMTVALRTSGIVLGGVGTRGWNVVVAFARALVTFKSEAVMSGGRLSPGVESSDDELAALGIGGVGYGTGSGRETALGTAEERGGGEGVGGGEGGG